MSNLEKVQNAMKAAREILTAAVAAQPVTVDRKEELLKMTKAELAEIIIKLEKPKADKGVTIQELAKSLLVSPDCATLTYSDIAELIREAMPEAETSSKSIASYKSKFGEDWGVVPREKVTFTAAELINM